MNRRWPILLLVLGALALRVATGAGQSFWYDEVFSYRVVEPGFGGMLDRVRDLETTPPLFYALLTGWAKLFGVSELALRLPSALLSAGAVWLTARAAGRIGGERAALWAGTLVAVSPLLVWLGQDARAYSLAIFASAGLVDATVRWIAEPQLRRTWLQWAGWASLAIAANYPAWLLVPALAVAIIAFARPRPCPRKMAGAFVAPLAIAAAHVPFLREQLAGERAEWIETLGLGHRLVFIPKQLLIGQEAPAEFAFASLALVAVTCGAALAVRASASRRASIALLTGATLSVVVALISAAVNGPDLFITRSFAPLIALVAVPAGVGFAAAATELGRAGTLAIYTAAGSTILMMLGVTIAVSADPEARRPDWRRATSALSCDTPRVWVSPPMQSEVVRHYLDLGTCTDRPPRTHSGVITLVGNVVTGGGRIRAGVMLQTSSAGSLELRDRHRYGGVDLAVYDGADSTAATPLLPIGMISVARVTTAGSAARSH